MSLTNNTILRNNTTLLCITEQFNLQPVQWKYESLNGVSTDLASTTDMRGFSTINVTLDQPGIYSCNVSQDAGDITLVYTATLEAPGKSLYYIHNAYDSSLIISYTMSILHCYETSVIDF